MPRIVVRLVAVLVPLLLLAPRAATTTETEAAEQSTTAGPDGGAPEEIDYEAIGLWDDGPCDDARSRRW